MLSVPYGRWSNIRCGQDGSGVSTSRYAGFAGVLAAIPGLTINRASRYNDARLVGITIGIRKANDCRSANSLFGLALDDRYSL